MWGECIVLRAWSGAPKCGRLCVLEQEQSCGKNWRRVGTLLCSSQFEDKCMLNCAWTINISPINTHTSTGTHASTHGQQKPKQSVFFHRPALSDLSLFPSHPAARCTISCCNQYRLCFNFLAVWQPPVGQGLLLLRFQDHTKNSLDGWSARRRDLCLKTHNVLNSVSFTPSAGFEPAIPTSEQPQTHALELAATGIKL